jgi:hypothetical protein
MSFDHHPKIIYRIKILNCSHAVVRTFIKPFVSDAMTVPHQTTIGRLGHSRQHCLLVAEDKNIGR